MATIVNTKLGEHRGKKRVWLEGQKLLREGYYPGMKYDLELKDSQVVLRVKEEGKFTISKRERNGRVSPIIDLTVQELATVFDGVEMLRVFIRNGAIVISAHHQQERVIERVNRLISKLENGESLSVCSLFHGGGVLDKAIHAGFHKAGIASAISVAVEMEGKYLDSSLANNPELWNEDSIVIESPIQAVNLSKRPPQVDVLMGGIPCTGASKSGRSKNKLEFAESHEAAGAMFFNFLQFVEALNPAVVLIENVPEYQNTASMEVIRSVLSSLGYSLQERILDGNEFGCEMNHIFEPAGCVANDCSNLNINDQEALRWSARHRHLSKNLNMMMESGLINKHTLARELSDVRAAEKVMRDHNIDFKRFEVVML